MKKFATAAAMLLMMTSTAFAMDDDKVKMMVDDKISMIDTDNDAMVSEAEHDAAMSKMFSEADANGDKMLSRDELMAAKKKEWAKYKDTAPASNHTKTNNKAK